MELVGIGMKIFLSQPMAGKTTEQIQAERNAIMEKIEEQGHTVIDSVIVPDTEHKPLWFLAESLRCLSEADYALFFPKWKNSRGCRLEHMAAKEYFIPIKELTVEEISNNNAIK